jgi:hypothetical protein
MPTVSIISGTTGSFLAVQLGYSTLKWPAYGWVVAALILVALMTIQGLGFLAPVNVFVCLELQKIKPDMKNQLLDAEIFLLRCAARNDASGDYCRHEAFSSRHLSLLVAETICGFRQRA